MSTERQGQESGMHGMQTAAPLWAAACVLSPEALPGPGRPSGSGFFLARMGAFGGQGRSLRDTGGVLLGAVKEWVCMDLNPVFFQPVPLGTPRVGPERAHDGGRRGGSVLLPGPLLPAPQVIRKIRVEQFPDASGSLKLWCQFFNIFSDSVLTWAKDQRPVGEVGRR